uniref:Uncharacterized protein n=1 Tax=candidate division WOR-3 bacterium TaxID=2052148 RepID=A0A7C2K2P9_UNCW3
MKKLLLLLFLFSACIPRKVLRKELDIEKFQQHLRELYEELSNCEVKGSYTFKATNFNLSGKFSMIKKGKEWYFSFTKPDKSIYYQSE